MVQSEDVETGSLGSVEGPYFSKQGDFGEGAHRRQAGTVYSQPQSVPLHLRRHPDYWKNAVDSRFKTQPCCLPTTLLSSLAYLIVRELKKAWRHLDLTVEEGLEELNRLCAVKLSLKNGGACLRLPDPGPLTGDLLNVIDVGLPAVLPKSKVKVDSKKKLG